MITKHFFLQNNEYLQILYFMEFYLPTPLTSCPFVSFSTANIRECDHHLIQRQQQVI